MSRALRVLDRDGLSVLGFFIKCVAYADPDQNNESDKNDDPFIHTLMVAQVGGIKLSLHRAACSELAMN